MNIQSKIFVLGAFLALVVGAVAPAMADETNKKTEFTFNAPVQVPGQEWPAGKYDFEPADTVSNRNIVEIFSEDERGNLKPVTILLAIPEYRNETPDRAGIRFDEGKVGNPEPIHSWFYPGENTGWAFVY